MDLLIQADILGVPVEKPKIIETTALGAAYLAGLAVGVWKSKEESKKLEPNMPRDKAELLYNGWRKAVKHSMYWLGD